MANVHGGMLSADQVHGVAHHVVHQVRDELADALGHVAFAEFVDFGLSEVDDEAVTTTESANHVVFGNGHSNVVEDGGELVENGIELSKSPLVEAGQVLRELGLALRSPAKVLDDVVLDVANHEAVEHSRKVLEADAVRAQTLDVDSDATDWSWLGIGGELDLLIAYRHCVSSS